VLAFMHLTRDSEPRGEMQAGSDERSEKYLSSQNQWRELSAQLSDERQTSSVVGGSIPRPAELLVSRLDAGSES